MGSMGRGHPVRGHRWDAEPAASREGGSVRPQSTPVTTIRGPGEGRKKQRVSEERQLRTGEWSR